MLIILQKEPPIFRMGVDFQGTGGVGEYFWVTVSMRIVSSRKSQIQENNFRFHGQYYLPCSLSLGIGADGEGCEFWSGDVGNQEELLSLTIPLETCCGKELELHHLM